MRLTGGQGLARQLALEGVRTVFGIPGVQIYAAVDGIATDAPEIEFVTTRHEQATAYMADGYARATEDVGVCLVVPGPGVLNVMAALSTAYACCSRLLLLTGQIPSSLIGRGTGALHEIRDQSRVIATVTKWSALARTPEEIPGLVREAMRQLRTGTPRPVALEIPPDVLAATGEVELVPPPPREPPVEPDPSAVAAICAEFRSASRPLIVAGGGARRSSVTEPLLGLANALDAPVMMTENGLGVVSRDHPLAANPLEGRALMAHSDVILAIGTRFISRGQSLPRPPDSRLVMLNSDPAAFREPHTPSRTLLADALTGIRALLGGMGSERTGPGRAAQRVAAVRAEAARTIAPLQPQLSYLAALREAMPRDAIMVGEFTQVSYVAPLGFAFHTPSGNITPGYQGTLGYGFATALGAAHGARSRVVVSVNGDGGFGWNLQELSTARQYDIPVIAVVFDNGGYGNVARDQDARFGGRRLGVDLENPDFLALAAAFGIPAARATTPEELTAAVRSAAEAGGPHLVHVPVGEMPDPWGLLA